MRGSFWQHCQHCTQQKQRKNSFFFRTSLSCKHSLNASTNSGRTNWFLVQPLIPSILMYPSHSHLRFLIESIFDCLSPIIPRGVEENVLKALWFTLFGHFCCRFHSSVTTSICTSVVALHRPFSSPLGKWKWLTKNGSVSWYHFQLP